jgi:hypothetical protein
MTLICCYCKERLQNYQAFRHPFWKDEIVCGSCFKLRKPCLTCEKRSLDPRHQNILVCRSCASVGRIHSSKQLKAILLDSVAVLCKVTKLPFLEILPQIITHLASISQLTKLVDSSNLWNQETLQSNNASSCSIFGLCQLDDNNSVSSFHVNVFILNILSPLLAGAFLCHELIHAFFFFLRCPAFYPLFLSFVSSANITFDTISPTLLEEGLCHLAASFWLKEHVGFRFQKTPKLEDFVLFQSSSFINPKYCSSIEAYNQAYFWFKKFHYGQHPNFSIGFHTAKKLVRAFGWQRVCASLAQLSTSRDNI